MVSLRLRRFKLKSARSTRWTASSAIFGRIKLIRPLLIPHYLRASFSYPTPHTNTSCSASRPNMHETEADLSELEMLSQAKSRPAPCPANWPSILSQKQLRVSSVEEHIHSVILFPHTLSLQPINAPFPLELAIGPCYLYQTSPHGSPLRETRAD